ncbi:MAG: hypothetical protein ACRDPQ_18165 [Nocardioidaceae bacterium]|nr:hypothetical protein [Tepidisphaeraceae bacterium]
MGLVWRKRVRVDDDTDANLSKSGASVSRRFGRRLRLNSRGGGILPSHPRSVVAVRTAPLSNDVGAANDVMDNGDDPGSSRAHGRGCLLRGLS